MLALEVKNLNKSYDKFQLKDVSFQLEQGYIMGFIGANGAGKTTTLKAILNLIHIEDGTISVLGKSFKENELELKQEIGYTFGGIDYYTRSRIKKITDVVKRFYTHWDDITYQNYMKKFKLDEDKKVMELSAGMRVKYSLALALSHGAKLLILDEPTSGLDPVARDGLLDIFQELVEQGEVSILFSTHITTDLEKCADYITFIHNGQIINSMDKDKFLNSYRLINGNERQLDKVKDKLISYKKNSFGFTGLICTKDFAVSDEITSINPCLDDIMVYYSRKDDMYV